MVDDVFENLYKKTLEERQEIIAKKFNLNSEEKSLLKKEGPLKLKTADGMIENVVGTFPLPFGLATNFVIDDKKYVIPFAIEEPSVVAAASFSAKLSSGFNTSCDDPIMVGQIQVTKIPNIKEAIKKIESSKKEILSAADIDPVLKKFGGGPKDLKINIIESLEEKMLDLHLLVDVRDAMGANAINTMVEKISPIIEKLTGGKCVLRIISNLAIYRRAQAKTIWTKEKLAESTKGKMSGEQVIENILSAYNFAVNSPFRCVTHNKGIMNGIDAVVIATGNDFRAIESGAHAFACYETKYSPLTKYYKNSRGDLVGEIDIPMALGLVGGATRTHPMARLSLKILGVESSSDLARIIASVGLAQNFAALRALATTGIQKGHMKLHARNIAIQAGAKEEQIEFVVKKMIEEENISQANAEKILKETKK